MMPVADIDIIRLPERMDYASARSIQMKHVEQLAEKSSRQVYLLILEHEPLYTLGRTTKAEHVPVPDEELARQSGAEVVRADRGGSVTYHGPGQLTAYLILHLKAWELSLHRHLWNLEEIAIRTGAQFGIEGTRMEGMTGAWAKGEGGTISKYCAIGVGSRRWVTYHGLGLNVNLDVEPFRRIDPCGLGRPVTSLSMLGGKTISLDAAAEALTHATREVLSRSP